VETPSGQLFNLSGSERAEQLTDEELFRLFQTTRERSYFEILWRRHHRELDARCLALLRDSGAAADIVSSTFVTALDKADSYDAAQGAFSSWIKAIARHLCINYLGSGFVSRINRGGPVGDEYGGPADAPARAHEIRDVLKQIASEQRITLKLLYIGGYTYQEIAELQGWSVNEVKSYAQNGRRMFLRLWNRKAGT
jgi:RNA polymerase sigma-70 factor (ECF subfamily)